MWVGYWVGKRLCSRWVAFVFFSEESLQASIWVSLWNLWVLFSVIPASQDPHHTCFSLGSIYWKSVKEPTKTQARQTHRCSKNWEQSSISNYLAAGYVCHSVTWNEWVDHLQILCEVLPLEAMKLYAFPALPPGKEKSLIWTISVKMCIVCDFVLLQSGAHVFFSKKGTPTKRGVETMAERFCFNETFAYP